ncbi:hypothetical protein [Streptomyces sp. NPDC060366]|uniref:hypothetical protein n=1 Tax=Streptomyces sp. NPDC060366 TaxID=3347105 RepID=UPI00364F97BA
MKTTTAPTNTPDTDVTDNPHWRLTTAQGTDQFDAAHDGKPMKVWPAIDFETWDNLHRTP